MTHITATHIPLAKASHITKLEVKVIGVTAPPTRETPRVLGQLSGMNNWEGIIRGKIKSPSK